MTQNPDDRFTKAVAATLAKRAANRCSNPDCLAVTSGPADDPQSSVNVGEAAHIYGAHAGSARFRADMQSADRRNIANAIWLCGNCHKLVDDDPARFPAGLLYEWQKDHERRVAAEIGKTSSELRRRYEDRHLQEFGQLSYLAERLILEKAPYWEYRLTAEVLRFETEPVMRRWKALKRGLYIKPYQLIEKLSSMSWMLTRLAEIEQIVEAFETIMNEEFQMTWGEPGVPGDDKSIVSVCRLFAEMCRSALTWEEAVRFTKVDDSFREVRDLYIGIAGMLIDEASRLPPYLIELFAGEPTGKHQLTLTLSLPNQWVENVKAALARAELAFVS